jgi:hypothetical protein
MTNLDNENARFELEQAIIACSNISDDVDILLDAAFDNALTSEQFGNALLGMKELHELRCKKAFDIFSLMIGEGLIT